MAVVGQICHSRVVDWPEETEEAAEVRLTVGVVPPVVVEVHAQPDVDGLVVDPWQVQDTEEGQDDADPCKRVALLTVFAGCDTPVL